MVPGNHKMGKMPHMLFIMACTGLLVAGLCLSLQGNYASGQSLPPEPQNTTPITMPTTNHVSHTIYLPLVIYQEPPKPSLYKLTIAQEDLDWLYDINNRWTHETVPAIFSYESISYEVEVRFRGGTVRYLSKKSWKIDFPAETPFQGQRELNLNAEATDKSMLREALAYDVFESAGLPAAGKQFVRLEINGEYMGVFCQIEQIDQHFLQRIGWDPNGSLYKASYGANMDWKGEGYTEPYVKKTHTEDSHNDLMDFLWLVNITPKEQFPEALAEVMDVGKYLDWYAVQIALGNYEWLDKNYYIYHDLQEDWWHIIPWDLDLTLGHNWGANGIRDLDITWDNPIDSGTRDTPKVDGVWNQLITKVLEVDEFKFAYCRRLQELLNDEFTEDALTPKINSYYTYIAPYAEADPYKWGSNEEFHQGPEELRTYIANRRVWLQAQISQYCPDDGPMPQFNELLPLPNPTGALTETTPWIELYNPGLTGFDAGGMLLQTALTGTLKLQWSIPEGTLIPPRGYLVIWTDGHPEKGPLHAGIRLNPKGGTLTLLDKPIYGSPTIHQHTYETLPPGISTGSVIDGGEDWITYTHPTLGGPNLGNPPKIISVTQTPDEPEPGRPVTITAVITDAGSRCNSGLDTANILTATLHFITKNTAYTYTMHQTHALTEGLGHYQAIIPPAKAGITVTYYVQAEDTIRKRSYAPASQWPGTELTRPPANPYYYTVGFKRPPLYINELMAINENTLEDSQGDDNDWFEIYNAGSETLNLGGMYLTDALENTTKWEIPQNIVILPKDYLIFWADEEPEEGLTHTNFKLSGDGGRLALYAGNDNYNGLIDEVFFGPQILDQPWGRYPDGEDQWDHRLPTPAQPNRQLPPTIEQVQRAPQFPQSNETVTITAVIESKLLPVMAILNYQTDGLWYSTTMTTTGENTYNATIPAQPEGQWVTYYITATNAAGESSTAPSNAPYVIYGYQVGQEFTLVINEFMADNQTTLADETGKYEDWLELYNAGTITISLDGLYLSDNLSTPNTWAIPPGIQLLPGDFLLVWTDKDPGDGHLHADFKLSKAGEAIGLFEYHDNAYILRDWITFGPQGADIAYGRYPDGADHWRTLREPTPGYTNKGTNEK
ncbi:MAG: CotH kinase family protein [Anaerolineae bacterium]|nr:CotH kinase family protein [Anaerolineae bacterium]